MKGNFGRISLFKIFIDKIVKLTKQNYENKTDS